MSVTRRASECDEEDALICGDGPFDVAVLRHVCAADIPADELSVVADDDEKVVPVAAARHRLGDVDRLLGLEGIREKTMRMREKKRKREWREEK